MEHVTAKLVAAITHRHEIQFEYHPGMRIIEPHALGRGSDGQLLLRAYQTSGASASGEQEHWKLFRLDKASAITPTGEVFAGPRPGYRKGDRAMKGGIIAEI